MFAFPLNDAKDKDSLVACSQLAKKLSLGGVASYLTMMFMMRMMLLVMMMITVMMMIAFHDVIEQDVRNDGGGQRLIPPLLDQLQLPIQSDDYFLVQTSKEPSLGVDTRT